VAFEGRGMKTLHTLFAALALTTLAFGSLRAADATSGPVRGADELFWVPTLEQASDMSKVTGRPVFVMGYSLVGDGSTYTKKGPEICTGVF